MREEITASLVREGAIAVIRLRKMEQVLPVAEALLAGGVRALEVTLTVPGALEAIESIARELGSDAVPGVGSVTEADEARRAVDAGARYVLSPVYRRSVVEAAHSAGVPAIPGAFTPTEIFEAQEAGADLVKVFPADIVGMPFFRAVLAPLPKLRLVPTGGVTPANAGDWIRCGARAVGVGSALLDPTAIETGAYARLTENARLLIESVREGQSARQH